MLLMLIVNHVLRRSNPTKRVAPFQRIYRLFHPISALLLHMLSLLLVFSWSTLTFIFGAIVTRWLMFGLTLHKESL